jgi:predicted ArsR family transcriptional regulator
MTSRTRQLLSLLGDEVVGEVLTLCAAREHSRDELAAATGTARATVGPKLDMLATHGLLTARFLRAGGSGRPGKCWRLRNGALLDAFERQADEFVRNLLSEELAMVDDELGAAPPKGMRSIPHSETR